MKPKTSKEVLAHPSVYWNAWLGDECVAQGLATSISQAKLYVTCVADGNPDIVGKYYHLVRAKNI